MKNILTFFLSLVFVISSASCGNGGSAKQAGSPKRGLVESAFYNAEKTFEVPVRLLMAVGFHESNLDSQNSSAVYLEQNSDTEKRSIGFPMAETAFGVSRKALNLESSDQDDELEIQIEKYASWIAKEIGKLRGFDLKKNPSNVDERFAWLWAIGSVHVPADRNIRAVWVKGVINVLNEGRVWKDTRNGEVLELAPESAPINEETLSPQLQRLISFNDDVSDIGAARRFDLADGAANGSQNMPRRIEVIHCPMTLASCLRMQDSSIKSKVKLGAHYIIPQDSAVLARPIQVQDHERAVELIDQNGVVREVNNAVVVMLVGNSGKFVGSVRTNADPTWFTAWQLRKLGATVKGICTNLSARDPSINVQSCYSASGAEGIHFHSQGKGQVYRWGDIPDFEKTIFTAYLNSDDTNAQGEVMLNLPSGRRQFQAGQEFEVKTDFSMGARWVRLQRAVRCSDKQIAWDTVRTEAVLNKKNFNMKLAIWDAGPNQNGRQFLRVLTYDSNNRLLGWNVNDFFIENSDESVTPVSEACR